MSFDIKLDFSRYFRKEFKKQIMSIEIKAVSKLYGEQKALDNVSLSIKSGEIVGLLGPNGAGKSTLMKIITCFIPPTTGEVTINGHNIESDSLKIKKVVGYLPESNPLYMEMYIKEYLEFVAAIHKIPDAKKRIKEIIELTGLSQEQHKKIHQLSKGYKQRVGIAQALLPSPEVLILDEPTSGLDPNQLVDIRNLITEIGKEKTILLSTHIMQEVEAVCDRVIIINKGKIVADDSTRNLTSQHSKTAVISVEFDGEMNQKELGNLSGIEKVMHINHYNWIIESSSKEDIRSSLFKLAVKKNVSILSMNLEKESLETVFHRLTKK